MEETQLCWVINLRTEDRLLFGQGHGLTWDPGASGSWETTANFS